jgi:site-specific recombinase XerD
MNQKVSLKYYLLTTRTKVGSLPIYLRITANRKKSELYTGYTATIKEWSQEEQLIKNNPTINQELTKLKGKVYELIIDLEKKNKPISAIILKTLLSGKDSIDISLIEFFTKHLTEIEIRKEIKPISIAKYKQSLNSLNNFIPYKYKVVDLNLNQIDYDFINSYDLYLREIHNLHKNTINKYHTRLKTLLLRALAEGHIIKQPYANFKLNSVKTDREFLSQDELNKIINLDLTHNPSLDKVKDIFIFSVYTGLRFEDAQSLTINNLIKYKNKLFLKFIQQKTNRAIEIPLLKPAMDVINKYKDTDERIVIDKLLPKISNQKVNMYLKVIGDLSELNRKISHHIARHTFATTICLNNKMPLEDVSMLLGHSSIKTTQIYGKITQERLFNSMQSISKKI